MVARGFSFTSGASGDQVFWRKSTRLDLGGEGARVFAAAAAPATLRLAHLRVSRSLGYANWRKSGPGIEWVTWAAWRAAAGMEIGRSLLLWVWRGPTAHLLFFRYKHPLIGVPFGACHRDCPWKCFWPVAECDRRPPALEARISARGKEFATR